MPLSVERSFPSQMRSSRVPSSTPSPARTDPSTRALRATGDPPQQSAGERWPTAAPAATAGRCRRGHPPNAVTRHTDSPPVVAGTGGVADRTHRGRRRTPLAGTSEPVAQRTAEHRDPVRCGRRARLHIRLHPRPSLRARTSAPRGLRHRPRPQARTRARRGRAARSRLDRMAIHPVRGHRSDSAGRQRQGLSGVTASGGRPSYLAWPWPWPRRGAPAGCRSHHGVHRPHHRVN